jgi:hypothetical protein
MVNTECLTSVFWLDNFRANYLKLHVAKELVVGPGEVAQINIINSLRVKHFQIAGWDHYDFSPIVKTAGWGLKPRDRRPKIEDPVATMLTLRTRP